jgi:hypothetical protein
MAPFFGLELAPFDCTSATKERWNTHPPYLKNIAVITALAHQLTT